MKDEKLAKNTRAVSVEHLIIHDQMLAPLHLYECRSLVLNVNTPKAFFRMFSLLPVTEKSLRPSCTAAQSPLKLKDGSCIFVLSVGIGRVQRADH